MNSAVVVYGHRELNFFFRQVVEVTNDGFIFQGRRYLWNAVRSVELADSPFRILLGLPWAIPTATVVLNDDSRIHLNGRVLTRQGLKPKITFFTGKSDAFVELVSLFRQHVAAQQAA